MRVWKSRKAGLLAGLLAAIAGSAAFAQERARLTLYDIQHLAGKVIARGSNQEPATELKLLTYRVEALELPQAVRVKLDGRIESVEKAWRVTVTGQGFRVGAMPAVLLVDEQPVAVGQENVDLTELSFVVFNPRFVRHGARLALTYEGDLLIDARDPALVVGELSLPEREGARVFPLPETLALDAE